MGSMSVKIEVRRARDRGYPFYIVGVTEAGVILTGSVKERAKEFSLREFAELYDRLKDYEAIGCEIRLIPVNPAAWGTLGKV